MHPRPITLRISLFLALAVLIALPVTAQVSASLAGDGNTILYSAGTSNPSYYCIYVLIDGINERGGACGGNGNGNSTSGKFECNWIGGHTVSAYATGNGVPKLDLGSQTVVVTAQPPAFCTTSANDVIFDITDNQLTVDDRRVLLSNTDYLAGTTTPAFPYPHYQDLLAQDKVIPVNMRVLFNATPTSGAPVTLTIIDPADPSPYVAGAPAGSPPIPQPVPGPGSAFSSPGDNVGRTPTLTGTNLVDLGNSTYSAVSGENGFIGTVLHVPNDAAAGDNYRIQATATFPDGSTKTATSGLITVWKRMFVEKKRMFRRGGPIATDAPAGLDQIVVGDGPVASAGATAFARNNNILLVHAPTFGQPKTASSYYSDLYRITQNPVRFRAAALTNGVGTLTTNGTTAIAGVGTRFTRSLVRGSVITIGGTDVRVVLTIQNDTNLTVDLPTTTSQASQPYTIGDPHLIAGTYYRRLQLDRPLARRYQREPLMRQNNTDLALNDAAVVLAGTTVTASDYFDVDESLLVGTSPASKAFPAAYTEYVVLPAPNPAVAGAVAPRMILDASAATTQRFIDKWLTLPSPTVIPSTDPNPLLGYRYMMPPNHQLVLVGDSNVTNVTQSGANGFLSKEIAGEKGTVLDRGSAEYWVTQPNSAIYQADPGGILRRTLVHEIVHQWWTNATVFNYADHCPDVAYTSAANYPPPSNTPIAAPTGIEFCLMSYPDLGPTMLAPWDSRYTINMIQYFYRFGLTSLHIQPLNGSWHSEYLSIRRNPDPWTPCDNTRTNDETTHPHRSRSYRCDHRACASGARPETVNTVANRLRVAGTGETHDSGHETPARRSV